MSVAETEKSAPKWKYVLAYILSVVVYAVISIPLLSFHHAFFYESHSSGVSYSSSGRVADDQQLSPGELDQLRRRIMERSAEGYSPLGRIPGRSRSEPEEDEAEDWRSVEVDPEVVAELKERLNPSKEPAYIRAYNRRRRLLLGDDWSPEDAADDLRHSTTFGVLPEVVASDRDRYRRLSKYEQFEKFLEENPPLEEWFDDPDNLSVAKDDSGAFGQLNGIALGIRNSISASDPGLLATSLLTFYLITGLSFGVALCLVYRSWPTLNYDKAFSYIVVINFIISSITVLRLIGQSALYQNMSERGELAVQAPFPLEAGIFGIVIAYIIPLLLYSTFVSGYTPSEKRSVVSFLGRTPSEKPSFFIRTRYRRAALLSLPLFVLYAILGTVFGFTALVWDADDWGGFLLLSFLIYFAALIFIGLAPTLYRLSRSLLRWVMSGDKA